MPASMLGFLVCYIGEESQKSPFMRYLQSKLNCFYGFHHCVYVRVSVPAIAVTDAAPVYSRIILYEVNSLYSVTLYCCEPSFILPLIHIRFREPACRKVEILIYHYYPFSNNSKRFRSFLFVVLFVSSYLYYLHPRTLLSKLPLY